MLKKKKKNQYFIDSHPILHPISEMCHNRLLLRSLRFSSLQQLLWDLITISVTETLNDCRRADWFVKDLCVSVDRAWQLLCSGEIRSAEQCERERQKAEERQQEQITYSVLWWRQPPPALWGSQKETEIVTTEVELRPILTFWSNKCVY